MKKIQKGRFYAHFDASRKAHPVLIVNGNRKKNDYKYVSFTHAKKHSIKLKHNIDGNDSAVCYIRNNPGYAKSRELFTSKNFKKYKVHKEDKPLVKVISRRK